MLCRIVSSSIKIKLIGKTKKQILEEGNKRLCRLDPIEKGAAKGLSHPTPPPRPLTVSPIFQ